MNRPWRAVRRACIRKGLEVVRRGSEQMVKGPAIDGHFRCVRIGHQCCRSQNSVVRADIVAKIKRTFGLTEDDFT